MASQDLMHVFWLVSGPVNLLCLLILNSILKDGQTGMMGCFLREIALTFSPCQDRESLTGEFTIVISICMRVKYPWQYDGMYVLLISDMHHF